MKRITVAVLVLLAGLTIGLGRTQTVEAGIYNASGEVTYKEYWMDHDQFTGHCNADGTPESPNGSWFVEPGELDKCPKSMQLTIPDNFGSALRAELYLDLWRNYDPPGARFRIEGSPTVYTPDVGSDWSRTPWVEEIPLSALKQGVNTFTFWTEHGLYHIHDIAVRIYYDDTHPLIGGGVNPDVTPPDGELISITSLDNNIVVPASAGGLLPVNFDTLTFKASATDAKYVEFHGYYDGYDDDNDGDTIDWHNVARNNWQVGGRETVETGGTINHIGTQLVPVDSDQVTQTWDLKHIINQSGVKFKIRVVDAAGNVREGAGGVTPAYTLARNYPVVYYTIPNFIDFGLHMSGQRPDSATYTFPLPADLNPLNYSEAYLLGMYWKRPLFSWNGSKAVSVRDGGGDDWTLGMRALSKTLLTPGNNTLIYSYTGKGIGHFVEKPGPMLVLRGNKVFTPDTEKPYVISRSPAPGSANVDTFSSIIIQLGDLGAGVDRNRVIMSVNGQQVFPKVSGPSNNLTATYTPTAPLPPSTEIPVTIYTCDLLNNCMSGADLYTFTTEPPDETPPVIGNVNVVSTDVSATITWTTNEAADSKVSYGLTTGYEKGSVSQSNLVTQHSMALTGLQAESTYNFQLRSADYDGNAALTANLTFQTKRAPGQIISDDFSQCAINSGVWSYINPLNDSPLTWTGTGAQIAVPAGVGHDIWKNTFNSPRLMQYITNQDFDVEVKFETAPTKKTQSMGVLVQQDNSNYLRFNFQNEGNGINTLVLVNGQGNNTAVVFTTPVALSGASYMRINRAGDIWNLQYSTDGVNWTFATSHTRTLVTNQIGPFVGNTGNDPAHTNTIDYFMNLAAPITNEDPPITLSVTQVGEGTVTRAPNKERYGCNEAVTLTATPATDWTFAGWSGDITDTNATALVTMTESKEVIATFTNTTPYTVNVDVVSHKADGSDGGSAGGAVTKGPNQPTYLYGEEIELTAAPTPGWSFMGWSGDWEGAELIATVPVTGNMDITATFDQDEYTVETLVINEGVGAGGAITVEPDKESYLYGEPVTVTVTTEVGWTFAGWEGEGVSGTDPMLNLTMTGDVVAIARLVQDQYDLAVEIISEGEGGAPGGTVTKTPDQTTYGYGQTVQLTAAPAPGWAFTGWGGALEGVTPAASLTITEDVAVTATFTQQHYTVAVTTPPAEQGTLTVDPVKPYYLYGDIVTLTASPTVDYDFVGWSGDIQGNSNPVVIAVDKNYTVTATFALDTTPIEITSYSVQVMPGGTVAVVRWTTDVPGDSQVDYGEEPIIYEGGQVSEPEFVTAHEVMLTGLTPETLYHFQITSNDTGGNEVKSEDLTFSTSSSSGLISDDFSACELDSRWTWIDPLGDAPDPIINGRQLEISVPAGTAHNVWLDGINAPRLMQPSNDSDFTIEVKFDSALTGKQAIQGVLVQQDDQTFIRFDFYKRNDGQINVFAAAIEGGTVKKTENNTAPEPATTASMYMRIVRSADNGKWQQFYSFDGQQWTKNADFVFDMNVKRAGVFAGNVRFRNAIPAHTAVVDYFINTAAPIANEDAHYQVGVEIEGSGVVTADPQRPGYYCGQQVTLTAQPAIGWTFVGWSGDTTGTSPTRTISVTKNMAITARFVQGDGDFRILAPFILR